MDKALAIAESSTLGLLTLITGTSPPDVVRKLLLPPLDLDMSAPPASAHSEPSTMRKTPHPIHTQMTTDATMSLNGIRSSPSPPTAYDDTVIPPTHDARTLILCFDGTGDQFDADVRLHFLLSRQVTLSLTERRRVPLCRIRTSCSSSRCSRRTTRRSRWFTIRYAVLDLHSCEAQVQTQHQYCRLASERTTFQRSRRHSGRKCTRPSTWLSAITLTPMSWVRHSLSSISRLPKLTSDGFLTGGYEFLMEHCTSFWIALAQVLNSHFRTRSRRG